ncbi:ABC transporter substrate-binding protein [Luteimicrobium sp. DT211]|uniref:ABC transporter substrate-binding protein n=1 Tax=Luteimicrobium sp. DT211 TaxID=3393412 RepID=UPI003CFAE40B
MNTTTRTRRWGVAAVAAVVGLGLAACSSGGGGSDDTSTGGSGGGNAKASCTNKIKKPDATKVTVWAWYPGFQGVVDQFNTTHDDVQVCWTNAGQGGDEYNKFSTAIQAGKGAPDVIMLENEMLPTFETLKGLADMSQSGATQDLKSKYTEGSWSDVTSGDGIYAIPVDGGPVGLLVRKDIFDKYKVKVPTTWDEYATAAQQLKDAGYKGYITDFAPNTNSGMYALWSQAGATTFTYDAGDPTKVGVALNTTETNKVLDYWNQLLGKGLVGHENASTTDYNTHLVDGTYASVVAAAWLPGYLQGMSGADKDAQWQAVPLPQWDAANPVQVNIGGSSFSVTSQAKDKKAATEVAMGLFSTDEAWKIGIDKAALFPQFNQVLNAASFTDKKYPFFNDQQINKDVFVPAAAGYKGFQFSPFQTYVYDQQTQAFHDMVTKKQSAADTLSALQDKIVKYAQGQGYTVSQ